MRRRDLLGGLSLVPLAAPAVAQCVVATFPRINLADRCEGGGDTLSLDLSFMTPGTLDPRITFTRASIGTYFDAAGVMQTAATNAPRWDYNPTTLQLRGLLIEEARTNVLLNSATLSTQSVTVTAQAYMLSFYGTGTITKSGTATGALVGTGAAQRVSQTFTPTAGSLTLTVTGTVSNAQLEAGAFPTSYIPTTGAAATRALDVCTMPTASFLNATAGTLFSESMVASRTSIGAGQSPNMVNVSDGTNNNLYAHRLTVGVNTQVQGFASNVSYGVNAAGSWTVDTAFRLASTYTASAATICLNGGAVATTATWVLAAGLTTMQMGFGRTNALNGYVRRVQYWPRVFSDAELQAIAS